MNSRSTPTMSSLLLKEFIEPLTKLGKTNWLTIVTESSRHRLELDGSIYETLEDEPGFLQGLVLSRSNANLLIQFLAYSKILADGPKIVQPTTDQCQALAHVDLKLKFKEYEQPFPAFIVEVPLGFQRQLATEYLPCPRFAIPFHDRSNNFLTVICSHRSSDEHGVVCMTFSRNMLEDTMEESLQCVNENDGPDYQQARVLERVALNLSLLLTRYGFRDDGPIDSNAFQKQSKLAKSKSERKRKRAQRLLNSSFNRISLSQDIEFVNTVNDSAPSHGLDGSKKSPHWRRGHFRRARVGKGRTERRLIFVRPSFINPQHFDGDRANSEYRIRTDNADIGALTGNSSWESKKGSSDEDK